MKTELKTRIPCIGLESIPQEYKTKGVIYVRSSSDEADWSDLSAGIFFMLPHRHLVGVTLSGVWSVCHRMSRSRGRKNLEIVL